MVKEDFVCRQAGGYFRIPSFSRKRESSLCFIDLCASAAALDARLRGHDGLARHLRRGVLTILERKMRE